MQHDQQKMELGSLSIQTEENISEILSALKGDNNDQTRIAIEGLKWVATILRKNADYGSSVWKRPILAPDLDPGTVILVRMTDKISRIEQLRKTGFAQVKTESLDDTISDLGAYCLLYLARPK